MLFAVALLSLGQLCAALPGGKGLYSMSFSPYDEAPPSPDLSINEFPKFEVPF